MTLYLKITAYLITRFAKRMNPKLSFSYLGNSIMWGYFLINFWITIICSDLIIESVFPWSKEYLYKGKILNQYTILFLILMITEFFIFFSRNQWKTFIPEIEQMERKKRRKICWRVIWFFLIAVPVSIVLLLIKYPMLHTWTG